MDNPISRSGRERFARAPWRDAARRDAVSPADRRAAGETDPDRSRRENAWWEAKGQGTIRRQLDAIAKDRCSTREFYSRALFGAVFHVFAGHLHRARRGVDRLSPEIETEIAACLAAGMFAMDYLYIGIPAGAWQSADEEMIIHAAAGQELLRRLLRGAGVKNTHYVDKNGPAALLLFCAEIGAWRRDQRMEACHD